MTTASSYQLMTCLIALVCASVLAMAAAAPLDAGVCYRPSVDAPSQIQDVLRSDLQVIATQFRAIRTYHAQFYNTNIIHAVNDAGLQVAIGIQLAVDGKNHSDELMDKDVEAAVEAATLFPDRVLAIYAGNENLRQDSADVIIDVINRVKTALQGTPGANVPVGTVQRVEEWLHSPGAAKLAAVCDVVGANIYPFSTAGGQADMRGTLETQWKEFAAKYGPKARLTETGWPLTGSASPEGNHPSIENAQTYFQTFANWSQQEPSVVSTMPFYSSMNDLTTSVEEGRKESTTTPSATPITSGSSSSSSSMSSASSSSGSSATEAVNATNTTTVETPDAGEIELSFQEFKNNQSAPLPSLMDSLVHSLELQNETVVPVVNSLSGSSSGPNSTTSEPAQERIIKPAKNETVPSHHNDSSTDGSNTTAPIITPSPVPVPSPESNETSSSSSGSSSVDGTRNVTETPVVDNSTSASSDSSASAGDLPSPTPHSMFQDLINAASPTSTPPAPPPAPAPAPAPEAPPAPESAPVDQAKAEQEALEAKSRVARAISGKQDRGMLTLAAFTGLAGMVAVAVIAVYVKKRRHPDDNDPNDPENPPHTTVNNDLRDSESSVYNDPLGTRYSSIVMITPNGDGVCIL